jgi:ATP-dependent Clp protease ATP-binding subunit ClpX
MTEAMFEVPSKKVDKFEVTADYVKEQLGKSHLE